MRARDDPRRGAAASARGVAGGAPRRGSSCLWEGERRSPSTRCSRERRARACAIVGPEGGLREGEVDRLRDAGASLLDSVLASSGPTPPDRSACPPAIPVRRPGRAPVMSPILVRGATMRSPSPTVYALSGPCLRPDAVEQREVREVRAHGHDARGAPRPVDQRVPLRPRDRRLRLPSHRDRGLRREPRAGAESMRLHAILHGDSLELGHPAVPVRSRRSAAVSLTALGSGIEPSIDSSRVATVW